MAKDVLWEMKPQTLGKHIVLRAYLHAWLPILGSWAGRILFIDAFAGPGEYVGGEEGSPLIAVRALKEHSSRALIKAEVGFYFIEADPQVADHLRGLLAEEVEGLGDNVWVRVVTGKFDDEMSGVLDGLDEQSTKMAPAFVMVDPFGVSGTPMAVLSRILQNPRTEVYVSFMWEWINRFRGRPEFERHLDDLFGCPDWRHAVSMESSEERKEFLYDLYTRQLKAAGATQVLRLELYRENRHVYTVFYGTKSLVGCDKMKQAMWKAAPQGDYVFRGRHGQLELGLKNPDFRPLISAIRDEFAGAGWIDIDDVINFVRSDRTDFHSAQVKTNALRKLEDEGLLEVDESSRKRRKTYPPGTRMRLVSTAED